MSDSKKVIVKSQEALDAFKSLGIEAELQSTENGGTGAGEEIGLLKAQVSDLEKSIADKDREIEALKLGSGSEGGDTITKALLDEKFGSLGTISKAMFDSIGNIEKSVADFTEAMDARMETFQDEIDRIGQSSAGRKSVSGDAPLEKAFTLDEGTGKKKLSKSQHGRAIVTLLDNLSETGDESNKEMYSDATVRYETSRQITKSVIDDLNESHDILIVE